MPIDKESHYRYLRGKGLTQILLFELAAEDFKTASTLARENLTYQTEWGEALLALSDFDKALGFRL